MTDPKIAAETAPDLRRGSNGEWVMYLKQLLDRCGYNPGTIDQNFDAACETAVRELKKKWLELPDDAKVDRATWRVLVAWSYGLEELDTHVGYGLTEDHDEKLGLGEEIGRKGWRRVDFYATILDHMGRQWPDGHAYFRFMEGEGQEGQEAVSDEEGIINNGRVHLNDVWVPVIGTVYMYVDSQQWLRQGKVGTVTGTRGLLCNGKIVNFETRQNPGGEQSVTWEEALEIAQTHGTYKEIAAGGSVQGGFSLILEVSTTFTVMGAKGWTDEQTTANSWAHGGSVTFTFPHNTFAMDQTR